MKNTSATESSSVTKSPSKSDESASTRAQMSFASTPDEVKPPPQQKQQQRLPDEVDDEDEADEDEADEDEDDEEEIERLHARHGPGINDPG